jgi:hypothetical protein
MRSDGGESMDKDERLITQMGVGHESVFSKVGRHETTKNLLMM